MQPLSRCNYILNVSNLRHRNCDFKFTVQLRLIQIIGRSSLGDQCAYQDIGVKHDPHDQRQPSRQLFQGFHTDQSGHFYLLR